VEDVRTHTSETPPPAVKGTPESRSASVATLDGPSPPTDAARPPPVLRHTSNQNPHTTSSGSSYSQPGQPGTDAISPPKPLETNTPTGNDQSRTKSLSAPLEPRRSMVSAGSSPSPGPPASDHEDISPAITRQSSTSARQDVNVAEESPALLPSAKSPPYEDATPPYSTAVSTKEAEAAAEKSLEAFADHRQSLPAYQSPIQERTPRLPFQPSAIVPVADLSARKRDDGRRPASRPFSFVDTNHEDILHRHTLSKESQHTSGGGSSFSKELGLDMSESGERPHSQSYSSHSNDPNVDQHPALRGSAEKPLPSQNRNYTPPQRLADQRAPSSMQGQSEQQYRIPGPYGQQFKFSKPVSFSTNMGQSPSQRPPQSTPQVGSGQIAGDTVSENDKQRRSDISSVSRPSTAEYSVPGVGLTRSPDPSSSAPSSRTTAAKLIRPRSRSGPHLNDDDFDLQRSQNREDQRKEKRSSIFRPSSRPDTESTSSQFGSLRGNASRSPSGISFQHPSPDMQAHTIKQNGLPTKGKEQKLTKRLQRSSLRSDQAQVESKKKGGFLRLSGLFGKSGKERPPGSQQEYVQRPVNSQSIQSAPLPRTTPPANSMPYQQQQFYSRGQDPARRSNDQRINSFRGQAPPVGGYYAPSGNLVPGPIEYQPRNTPRDSDSFIGGRRLSDQRAAEQARALEKISALRNQNQAQMPYPHAASHLSPKPQPQPQSAPASVPHFDRSQVQPRAASQRFPPDLRIDTSGRFNPNRRSQPPPVIGTMTSNPDPLPRAQPFPLSDSTNQPNPIPLPKHSKSTPQRQSPYTDRNSQHSPYGYGSARGLRKDNLSHAIDLHKRSRSPRNGRRDSYSSQEERTINEQDPANRLGTFAETGYRSRSKGGAGASGADGDADSARDDAGQEKPWKIDLPVGGSAGGGSSAGDIGGGGQRIPLSDAAGNSSVVAATPPVELPGSKAPGVEDSDEEIVMCSTAYPGQEWTPDMCGYGRWDD
jgi:hypothetical protein